MLTSVKARESALENKGNPDWNSVKRSVAASEPPRINDVPAHCKFIQKYGGNATEHRYIMDMLACLDASMPESRIVAGSFMDKLASLKLPPKEMIPRMAHACVILQACGPKVREDVGCTLTEGHIKSLTTSCKAAGLKGELTISKAYELLDACQPDQKSKGMAAIGKFQCDIVMHIFDLDDTYVSLDAISETFLAKFLGDAASQSSIVATPPMSCSNSNVVRYTADGNDAGRATVTNLGFNNN